MTTKTKLIELDPNSITVNTNVRRDLGDLRGLTRCVAEVGILEYLAGTGYELSDIELHVVNEANTAAGDGPGADDAA